MKSALAGRYGVLALASLGTSLPTLTLAADPVQAGPAVMEEVIITAQRRQESAQSVATAITALNGDELEDKAVASLDDLQFASPALTITNAALSRSINIRGIGLASGSPQVTPGVATYVDGIFQPPITGTTNFYDLDTVEVLRGPQGTFVGSSSTGGAIFINSRNPELAQSGGTAEVTVGNFSTRGGQGAINCSSPDRI